jgi:PAS domain S-box-containing protein
LLKGEQPTAISPNEQITFDGYDWRALKRWNISEDRLPSGSQVRYKTLTLWDTYKVHIIAGIGVICLETILIYALFISLMRIKRIKEALQQSEERHRALQENVPVGVYRTSYSGKFMSVNPAAFKIFGLDAEEDLSSYQVSDLYKDPEKRRDVLSLLKTEGKITDFEAEFRRKDGSLFWGALSATQVTDEDGNFIFIDGVVQDITIRKQAEEALKNSEEEARVLAGKLITTQEAERSRLARELHDDITQRLALLNIEVDKLELRHKSLSEPIKERLRQIGDNLGELSSDIAMISRQLHPSILDDLGLIQAIESECNNFTRLREIPVTLDLDTTLHNLSRETGLCVYRILQEGLRNIDQHARATHIQVQLSQNNNTVYFVLRDNGVGFDLDSSSRRRGLGLASMGERARLINGDLSIEPRPGKGTVIKLEAPFVAKHKD